MEPSENGAAAGHGNGKHLQHRSKDKSTRRGSEAGGLKR